MLVEQSVSEIKHSIRGLSKLELFKATVCDLVNLPYVPVEVYQSMFKATVISRGGLTIAVPVAIILCKLIADRVKESHEFEQT